MSVQRLELGSALYGARGAAYRTEAVRLGAPTKRKSPARAGLHCIDMRKRLGYRMLSGYSMKARISFRSGLEPLSALLER